MGKIFWLIILVIVAIALYNVFSNLSQNLKFQNISGFFRVPSGLYSRNPSTVGYSVNGGNPTTVTPANPQPIQAPPTFVPPSGFTQNQLSPFYGQVKVGSQSQGDSYNPSRFSVRADYSMRSPIDITGWSLRSNKGILFFPGAVSDYDPSGLASAGDLILNSGDYVNFYSNYSPVSTGLRLNECTGYLNNSIKFNPVLPNSCPTMYNRSEIAGFSGACQNLVMSLWGCSIPSPEQINSVPDSDGGCRTLLMNRFNYNGCYRYHRSDANFFSNEWRVWLSTLFNFDWNHDRLMLFDRNNLLVDDYVY